MEMLFEITGWAGAVAMLGGYMAVSMGWLQAGSTFQTVNLFGSCAFIINGTLHGAWPSVVTNVAWFLISAVALLRMKAKQQPSRVVVQAQESPSLGPDTAAQVIVTAARPAASCA
ncbi:CBU_0592 family membrane protein [Paenarthrobacter nitroguajacolicus]|uniref:CBU_0592 family membrane protein n=1 Tax=Paenarthrobacter nitroguajacolicus TaxID=211146 RepID=UPI0040544711